MNRPIIYLLLLAFISLGASKCRQEKKLFKQIKGAQHIVIKHLTIDTLVTDYEVQGILTLDVLDLEMLSLRLSTNGQRLTLGPDQFELSADGKAFYLDSLHVSRQVEGAPNRPMPFSAVQIGRTQLNNIAASIRNKKGKQVRRLNFSSSEGKSITVLQTTVHGAIGEQPYGFDNIRDKYREEMTDDIAAGNAQIERLRLEINRKIEKDQDHPIGEAIIPIENYAADLSGLLDFVNNIDEYTPLELIQAKAYDLGEILESLNEIAEDVYREDNIYNLASDLFFKPGKWDITNAADLNGVCDHIKDMLTQLELNDDVVGRKLIINVVGYADEQGFFNETIRSICTAKGLTVVNNPILVAQRKAFNQALSELRAEAVEVYLNNRLSMMGLSNALPIEISTKGRGETLPPNIIPKSTADDQERRRVMVYVQPMSE